MFENADLYRTNWRKRYTFTIVRDIKQSIWRTGEHYSQKLYMIFEQWGTMENCVLLA